MSDVQLPADCEAPVLIESELHRLQGISRLMLPGSTSIVGLVTQCIH